MSDYVTDSGLVVSEHRRYERANERPPIDPRAHDPNPNPPSTVGPNDLAPGRTVMYPTDGWHAEAWDGWPTEWHTPSMGADWQQWSGEGYGRQNPMFGRVSTAMTCVDLNSRQLGSFPIYGMRRGQPFTLPDWRLNPEPELYSGWADFMHVAVNSLLLRGECILYATGRYADGQVSRFAALNPDAVDIELVGGKRVVSVAGAEIDAPDVQVVRYQAWPGRIRGVSPLEWIADSLSTSGALERYASGLATRGGVPWAVLKSPRSLDRKQALDAQASWVAAAARRDGAPAVLGNAFDLQTLSLSPRDMALLELREFDERRICAAFGVPAFLVNVAMASGLTYTNAESLFRHHWTATLRPLAQTLADGWSAWLLPRGSAMEFNPDRYTQPPLAERAQAWSTLFGIVDPTSGERAMTIDEIRTAERLTTPAPVTPAEQNDAALAMTGGTP